MFLKNKPLVKTLTYMIKTMTINTNKCFIHLHIKPHLLSLITQNNSKVIRKLIRKQISKLFYNFLNIMIKMRLYFSIYLTDSSKVLLP